MDIQRPDPTRTIRRRWTRWTAIGLLIIAAVTTALLQLKPAALKVDRNTVWIDTVKRGEMIRQVRGLGTLVPEEIRWIAARTQGRVDRVLLRPGAFVEPESVILVLSNPEAEQAAINADAQLIEAEAELENLKVQVRREVLAAESTAASAKATYEQSKLKAEANDELFKNGLVAALEMRLSKVVAEHALAAYEIEQKRLAFAKESVAPQLAVKESEVKRLRAQAKLRHAEFEALSVRAGMAGVLQVLPVEIGAHVEPGANLARVADPHRLKAELRIAETQAKDILVGQVAQIDTHNGVVEGRVGRIDPSVQNGTVTVDVILSGNMPKGIRPDLSVEGTLQLERLDDVIFIGRPAFAQDGGMSEIFKMEDDGIHAKRTRVQFGRSSVSMIEIAKGLEPGDRVILSDMSQWDAKDRIRVN